MKLIYQSIKYYWFILILSVGLGQEKLELENNNNGTWNVLYTSFSDIAGFQFDVDGDGVTVNSAYGGAALEAGFTVTTSSTTVIGLSLSGTTIPAGIEDTLVVIDLTGSPTMLSNIVFSELNGNPIDLTFFWEGCPDEIACNYEENATADNGIESCIYPCSTCSSDYSFTGCCDSDSMDLNFNCLGECQETVDCDGNCGGDNWAPETCTGCLDDGYQQWSPFPGTPGCNFDPFTIISGQCLYNDCLGVCPEVFQDDWVPNPDFTDTQYDECEICGGICFNVNSCVYCDGTNDSQCDTCADCANIPNGSAYLDACDQCVGGDTGISDCLSIDLSFGGYMESNSSDTIKVFVTNLDTLKSLDMEFIYENNIINITDFSIYGTALNILGLDSYDYEIAYDIFLEGVDLSRVKFTMYFEPHNNIELFLPNGEENIFNILLESMDIESNITTQLIIENIFVNEIKMSDANWGGGDIMVVVPTGCTDESACNYDPNAREDDGSCEYFIDCLGECGGNSVYDVCEVCDGSETDINNCLCTNDNNIFDCNGDCPPFEGCPSEFSIIEGCAFKDSNCSDVCVGGATGRLPCEQDCTGEWGGNAYEDYCEVCISNSIETIIPGELDTLDCFNSSFQLFDSDGIEVENFILKNSDTIYVALQMQNLPDSLEGVIIDLEFAPGFLSLIDSKMISSEFDTGLILPELLDTSYVLYESNNNGIFLAAIALETTNVTYQGNEGNILFLQFFASGNNGDSTIINYNKVQLNEHVMKDQNYTTGVIYFGDCNGIFNGPTPFDECGVCGGPGIPEGVCDCEGNTATELYGEGYNCDGELLINESLIPQKFTISQNYPNPFNPITYIQYTVPHFDFIKIDIINISGQIIKTIVKSSHQPGNYEIMWNGTNQNGISVPSGIYFYKMDTDEFVFVRKLVLLK